jgi:D-beta-D-heptose 7-phosphate kinase/D-beta-D-heptose 1-phosphate adenosyltransferase
MINIFTNGCFDIIHVGHIELLKHAKSLGDKLFVGLNSDNSIKMLKGSSRPINFQEDRKKILESIKYVDEVIIFDELTPLELIKKIKPNIIVKGGDYKKENVIGYGLSEVIIFNYLNAYSTTKTIKSISDGRLL